MFACTASMPYTRNHRKDAYHTLIIVHVRLPWKTTRIACPSSYLFYLLSLEYSGRFVVSPADAASAGDEEFKQRQQRATEELASARSSFHGRSQQSTPTMPSSSAQTPSGAETPSSAAGFHGSMAIPRIAETPTVPPESPSSTGSGSDNSSAFLAEGLTGSSKNLSSIPRGSIPGGEKGE
jgi:hypothetical protein